MSVPQILKTFLFFFIDDVLIFFSPLCLMQRPHKAYPVELAQFHSADYVEFLHRITPDTQHLFSNELARCMYHIFFFTLLVKSFKTDRFRSYPIFSKNEILDCLTERVC